MMYACQPFPISLGSSQTSKTVVAQLVDAAGAPVGGPLGGVVELGGGIYQWSYASFPDGFAGQVTFTVQDEDFPRWAQPMNPALADPAKEATATAVKAKTDLITTAPATEVTALAVKAKTDLITTAPATEVTALAVKAKTDLIPATPAAEGTVAAVKAKTDLITTAPATEVTALAVKAKTDLIPAAPAAEGTVAAVKARTDLIPAIPAAKADIPTTTQIDTALGLTHGTGSWETGESALLAAIKLKTDLIGSGEITFLAPIQADGTLELVQGDDYLVANGKAIQLRVEDWAGPSLAGATLRFALVAKADYDSGDLTAALEVVGTAVMVGTAALFTAELTAAQTAALDASPPGVFYNYLSQVRVLTAAGHLLTIETNAVHVAPGV